MAELPEPVVAAVRAAARPVCAYVYHRGALRERAAALTAALPCGVRVLYAVKANGHPAVVGALVGELDGLEVASGGELAIARRFDPGMVAFSGPAKTDDELRAAGAAGAIVHVESELELRRLAAMCATGSATGSAMGSAAPTRASTVRVAIRVNRAAVGLTGSHRMTGEPTAFGVDEAALPGILGLARELPGIDLLGFHLHAVSNNLDAVAHAAFARDALAWSVRTAAAYRFPLRYVNLGGGLGVDYTGDREFDPGALAEGVLAEGVLGDGSAGPADVVLEPGRWLAAGAGWYAAEVLDLKRTHGRWFAVLRGGTHHFRLPAAWGYSHPFTVLPVDDWPYGFARPQVRDVPVDVAGELCTPRDVLARGRRVARLRAGDVLVFGNAGAYGWDLSHHEFLRHPYPEMIVI
ncbi:MAG TPA: type III PLP-dependent enzyme [Micromonosporaceae bacterium]|jgi:diaminopimelate decarboxylase|nr:type III PLP-dependent enzyme [Micromonosporaceae bacterium]